MQTNHKHHPNLENKTLIAHGYSKVQKISDTMQGEVYIAIANNVPKENKNTINTVVIKTALKWLHEQHITVLNGIKIKVKEDIIREADIMKSLNEKEHIPSGMIKYIDFFQDDERYYLVMENGGQSFLQFVLKCHALIKENKLSIREWRKHCKHMFAQMIMFEIFLNSYGYCNLDISLENMLISHGVTFKNGKLSNCYVKFVDFGLSEYYPNRSFACNKHAGKGPYMAPKVYLKQPFDARKADVWSLGSVLFLMLTGTYAYNKPITSDYWFGNFIEKGHIKALLKKENIVNYITFAALDLITKLWNINESKRICLDQICKHKWLRSYFETKNDKKNNTARALLDSLHKVAIAQ